MRQVRIVSCKGKQISRWSDVNSLNVIIYLTQTEDEWNKKGYTYEDIHFEYRNKPNIFTRIKEWWNND